jgi:hypothetical protein
MLGHLVTNHAADEHYASSEPAGPGWMRRVLRALFWRRNYTGR